MKRRIIFLCLAAVLLLGGCGRTGKTEAVLAPAASGQEEFSETDEKASAFPASGESAETKEPKRAEEAVPEDLHPYDFTLAFAGDVNFAEDWTTMEYYRQQENGIYDCIDPELIRMMREADLMCLNMEFSMSSVGSPMNGKKYTFRADPSRAELLHELGVDLVNLANNHIYDYGTDTFLDMLSILQKEALPYVGAGADAGEAEKPFYIELEGKKIAVVSATRAEKYILTPEALEDSPGVFRCYDTGRLLQVVKEADETADFVIAYIHWGTEYSEELEEAQTEGARALAEAGADVVLGAHPHCLQGVEFCDGVPILYSLGNYWFNEKTLDSVLVKLHFYGDDKEQHLDTILVPARQENHYTRLLTEPDEIEQWKEHVIHMSPAPVSIDEKGILRDGDQDRGQAGASENEADLSGIISEGGAEAF